MEQRKLTAHSASFIAVGQPVHTIDGKAVGRVAAVTSTHFQIRPRLRRPFWLVRERVFLSDSRGVVLACAGADLGAHRLANPWREGDPLLVTA